MNPVMSQHGETTTYVRKQKWFHTRFHWEMSEEIQGGKSHKPPHDAEKKVVFELTEYHINKCNDVEFASCTQLSLSHSGCRDPYQSFALKQKANIKARVREARQQLALKLIRRSNNATVEHLCETLWFWSSPSKNVILTRHTFTDSVKMRLSCRYHGIHFRFNTIWIGARRSNITFSSRNFCNYFKTDVIFGD